MAIDDGWPNTIHASKENGKKRRLDQDKRRDSKEKEGMLLGRKKYSFCCKRELAGINSCVFLRCPNDYMMANSVLK